MRMRLIASRFHLNRRRLLPNLSLTSPFICNSSSSSSAAAEMDKVRSQADQLLSSATKRLSPHCRRFDFDSETAANGVRSFLSIIRKFKELVHSAGDDSLAASYHVIGNTLSKVTDLMTAAVEREDDYSKLTDIDISILCKSFSFLKADVAPIFDPAIGPFWLHPYFQRGEGLVTPATGADVMQRLEVEANSLKKALPNQIVKVKIPVDRKFAILLTDTLSPATVTRVTHADQQPKDKTIDALLFKPQVDEHKEMIVIHGHGGGFVAMSPDEFVPVLHQMSDELAIRILCPDYAKAPSHPFPSGLQDLMDTYTFATSGSELVSQILGSKVKAVILTGDSAGGNLCTALTFAINCVNKLTSGQIAKPRAVVLVYPYSSPCWSAHPSILLANVDTFITAPGFATLVPMYAKTEPGTVILDGRWYRQFDAPDVMRRLSVRMRDPLFNNNAFTHWSDLSDIELHVMVCEFDPLMDQAISLAKNWRSGGGKVQLQVSRDARHGWLNTPTIAPVTQDFQHLIRAIRQTMDTAARLKSNL